MRMAGSTRLGKIYWRVHVYGNWGVYSYWHNSHEVLHVPTRVLTGGTFGGLISVDVEASDRDEAHRLAMELVNTTNEFRHQITKSNT